MSKLLTTIEITDDSSHNGIYCIHGGTHGALTLCGHVDVSYAEHDVDLHPPNCPSCLGLVKYCKALRLPKSVRAGREAKNNAVGNI